MSIRLSDFVAFCPGADYPLAATDIGFKSGAKGTHSSRTLMLADLVSVMNATTAEAQRPQYVTAITESNCLGKPTASTRRLSAQRLSELFGLDPSITLFRVFRRLWDSDTKGRELLALLMAIARDPLLAASAGPILCLPIGTEFQREPVRSALRNLTGDRFNPSILDKVLRNVASSWTQTGHLSGRTFKKREKVDASVRPAVFALYLAYTAGFRGAPIFTSGWFAALDSSPGRARELVLDAKRIGLIDVRIAEDVVDVSLERLDPKQRWS
jgi:hypothetical protein